MSKHGIQLFCKTGRTVEIRGLSALIVYPSRGQHSRQLGNPAPERQLFPHNRLLKGRTDAPQSSQRRWLHRRPATGTAVPPCGYGSRSVASHSHFPTHSQHYGVNMSAANPAAEEAGQRDRRPTSAGAFHVVGEAHHRVPIWNWVREKRAR
jgi:hypothetical protein